MVRLIALLILLAVQHGAAQTQLSATEWLADSTSRADIVAGIAATSAGDTLYLPPGDSTITTAITIPHLMWIVGSGEGQTILRHGITSGNRRLFDWDSGGGDHGFGHITFMGAGGTPAGDGYFDVRWGCVIGHCTFDKVGSGQGELFVEYGGMLMFDCTFIFSGTGRIGITRNGSPGTVGAGHGSWEAAAPLASASAIYLEDSTIEQEGSEAYGTLDGWEAGYYVVRFCTFTDKNFSNHGTESSETLRSHRLIEAYHNTMDLSRLNYGSGFIHLRGGNLIAFENDLVGTETAFAFSAYRVLQAFAPWGQADGTKGFDRNDTTDDGTGFDSGGSAGDGVFETGNPTATGDYTLTDTAQDWTGKSWVRYTCRYTFDFTASSATSTTVTVSPDPGWDTTANDGKGEWNGWEFTLGANNQKGMVFSNTSDTITLNGSTWPVPADVASGGAFQLSRAGYITANTATELTLAPKSVGGVTPTHAWPLGGTYEIRRVLDVMDCTGMGAQSTSFSGIRPQHNESVTRALEPAYVWNNTRDSGSGPVAIGASAGQYATVFVEGRNWFEDEADIETNPGIEVGTAAQMAATTPADTNSAFWVTDEGDWNSESPGADGQLYVWNGASWDLHYTPYTYPHPDAALLPAAYAVSGAAYGGRLRFNGTGAKPVRTDGVGQPIIFDQ